MASLISQMRNGSNSNQQQLPLNNSIAQTRELMQRVRNMQNPSAFLTQIVGQNPMLASAVQSGNLEQYARNLAAQKGIDIETLIRQLGGK